MKDTDTDYIIRVILRYIQLFFVIKFKSIFFLIIQISSTCMHWNIHQWVLVFNAFEKSSCRQDNMEHHGLIFCSF